MSERLRDATVRKRRLRIAGIDTTNVDREILDLRRQLRDGGQLLAGDELGDSRYLLVRPVGRGGFGVVWEAYDTRSEQRVAIKVLHSNVAGDSLRRERFFRGARAMMKLTHPAVVRVLEPEGEDGGFFYFVMELLSGGDLRAAVLERRLEKEHILPLMLRIIEAVAEAHAKGLVHRDIKPANILLSEDGNSKLTDFDLVGAADTTGGTRTGALGTFLYAAPECLDKPQEATARVDVYGLGMTAMFCFLGRDLPRSILRDSEPTIAGLDCSDQLKNVLRRAVEWEPSDRFTDAAAMADSLRDALKASSRGGSSSHTPSQPAETAWREVQGNDNGASPRLDELAIQEKIQAGNPDEIPVVLMLDLAEENPIDEAMVLAQLPPGATPALSLRLTDFGVKRYSTGTPSYWQTVMSAIDRLLRAAREREPDGRCRYWVAGRAGLPAFFYLGYRLTKMAFVTLVNPRDAGAPDVLRLDATHSAPSTLPYFTRSPWPASASQHQGRIGLAVSSKIRISSEHIEQVMSRRGKPLAAVVEAQASDPLDVRSVAAASSELEERIAGIQSWYPQCDGLAVFVAGPVTLAFLAGRAINPHIFPDVQVFQYRNREYGLAYETRPGREVFLSGGAGVASPSDFSVVKAGTASPQPAAARGRQMASERIDVTYRVVTPLFCGGASGDTAEVRLPSFKGVLRWWWRALAWSRLGEDLDEVFRDEDALFGSASGGQSKVTMRLIPSAAPKVIDSGKHLTIDGTVEGKIIEEGARYLGYGVMGAFGRDAGKLTRACLVAPFELKLELRVRDLDRPKLERLLDALRAVGLLGGLGAKSRKGYGSLVLRSMSVGGKSEWSPPASATALKDSIAKLLPADSRQRALPLYTALSPRSRVVLLSASGRSKPLELLNLIGREIMRYRSWGHNGLVLGKPREGNFKDDHDLMKQSARQRTTHPRRIAFGLPHNYGKRPEDKVGPADAEDGDRRASPLLVHIHECGETSVAVLSFLPAMFLSGGDSAEIDVGGKIVTIARDSELWKPINDLLNRFLSSDPKVRKELFGTALEVQP